MLDKYQNRTFRDIEIERKKQNVVQPYFQGTINTLDPSNRNFPNQSTQNQIKSIRLFSASNSFSKNHQQNNSKDKLALYKTGNNTINKKYYGMNYHTLQNRPTSVKQKPQKLNQQKKRIGGIGFSTELNYPCITLNSTNSQANNIPFQRKRNIVYEEDNELADEYDKLRKIWKEAGVTDVYIDNYETVTNNQNNTKEEILHNLKNEEQQMIKFKEELLKVVSETIKRENDIKNIRELNKKYLDLKTRINISPKKNVKNNNYVKEKEENEKDENERNEIEEEKRKELENERKTIEDEIERCLNSLRLHGINVVALIKKFNMRYEHLLNAGKIDLDFLKQKYGYDKNYLLKLRTDLDFLKDTDIGDLYHFSQKGKDPFLVSISIDEQRENTDKAYEKYKFKILPISEDMAKQIKLYNHLLNEIEIFTMMKNDYSMSNNFSNNYSHTYKYGGLINGISKFNDSYLFDSRFKTNNISKTRDKLITFNGIQQQSNAKFQKSISYKPTTIKLRTSPKSPGKDEKKTENQKEVEKLKKNLAGPYISKVDNDVENNKTIQMPKIKSYKSNSMVEEESSQNPEDEIVKEVETRVNKEVINKLFEVENRVKKQVEEKLKKDQERIEEEEKRLKKEKEKIEELRKIEEEKRQKDREKWEKIEKDRIKREEEERKKNEEEEKIKKEQNDQFKRDIEQKFLFEIEQRFKREENERKRRAEENNLMKRELELKIKKELEEERRKRERDERIKAEMKEKIRIEEIEKIREKVKKDEFDRIRREEIDRIDKEREERMKIDEMERNRKEEEERLRKEIERLKKENEERKEKAEDERRKREEEEKMKIEREEKLNEEIERLKRIEAKNISLQKDFELEKKKAEEREKDFEKQIKVNHR